MKGATRSYEMARRLVQFGHQVHIVTSDRRGTGSPYETEESGVRVTWIPVEYSNDMGIRSRVRAFAQFAVASTVIAAQDDPDIVFASSTPLTVALPGVYVKWKKGVPMVFEVRDLWPELPIAIGALRSPISKRLARYLERFAYRNSAHIIALSPGMKAGIIKTGYPADKVTVIPNSSDIGLFRISPNAGGAIRRSLQWLGARPLVTYTGTLGQMNGVAWLVDVALAMLDIDPEVRFLVVGDGKEYNSIRKYAEERSVLGRNFFMLPPVPKSQVPHILSASDICLSLFIDLREMWDNSANKFFDALAAGKPVAVNYGGWQANLIRKHGVGLVLNSDQYEAAAQALSDVLNDRGWLEQAGERAGRLAEEHFDRDILAANLESVLRSVVEEPCFSND